MKSILISSLCYAGLMLTVNMNLSWHDTQSTNGQVFSGVIEGTVVGKNGPIAGAIVKVQNGNQQSTTDSYGTFRMIGLPKNKMIVLVAWSPNYYNTKAELKAGGYAMIELRPISFNDNQDYEWLAAHIRDDQIGNCQTCHSDSERLEFLLPFDIWVQGAHAKSANNPLFKSVYLGQDLDGNQSPETRYGKSIDYGLFPLPPESGKAYYGPGYKLDFPNNTGNCAACHTPMLASKAPLNTDLTELLEFEREGIGCDICHKIKDVILDKETDLPYEKMPGILSYRFLRPNEDHQIFFGPKVDVAGRDDSYSPLHRQSRFCAGCHSSKFWGVEIYNSYGEWLKSSYADQLHPNAKSCQDCHMPVGKTDRFALLKQGGLLRDPQTIHVHKNSGSRDAKFMREAVQMDVQLHRSDEVIKIDVTIRNIGAGHHLPTGSPLRHIILKLEALDKDGNVLPQISGPHLPGWTGEYSGKPGLAYAKVLEEFWTGVSPTIGYWNQTRLVSDNRIPANSSDQQGFGFNFQQEFATIDVELIYVRALPQIRNWKGWPEEKIILAKQELIIE